MASTGHFLTMVGVLCFYIVLLEAHVEKKMTVYFHTIIARFNKRILYYLYKIVYYQYMTKNMQNIPSSNSRKILAQPVYN